MYTKYCIRLLSINQNKFPITFRWITPIYFSGEVTSYSNHINYVKCLIRIQLSNDNSPNALYSHILLNCRLFIESAVWWISHTHIKSKRLSERGYLTIAILWYLSEDAHQLLPFKRCVWKKRSCQVLTWMLRKDILSFYQV